MTRPSLPDPDGARALESLLAFWAEEYRLNVAIRAYPKPYVALIDGLVDRLEREPLKIVACGFGVGLSWGAFAGVIGPLTVAPLRSFPA